MIPYFIEEEVRKALSVREAYRLAEEVFSLMGRGRVRMPAKMYLDLPGGNDFRAMPAFLDKKGAGECGLKWISVFPGNPLIGRPTVNGTIFLNSDKDGSLLAIFEANRITALRTAAAAALASRHMANPSPVKLALIGAGFQAGYQLAALADLYPSIRSISVWGYRKGEAERFASAQPPALVSRITSCATVKGCVEDADIIVTCTPSEKPLIQKAWVKPGAHINAIGADAHGKQELDPKLLLSSKVVVDEWAQASHSGEINVPFSKGIFLRRHLRAELPDIVLGRKRARTRPSDITVFDSTGLAALDIAFAAFLWRRLGRTKRS